MSNAILVDHIGRSLVIRFNRPEIRNPLSVDVVNSLTRIVEGLGPDDGVERVIFTGSGGIFAAGADLREIEKVGVEEAKDFARRGQRLMNAVAALPLSIAAVNGLCFGGALDLALSCTQRVAEPVAEFCHPGVGIGIITGWGGTQRLPRLIGQAAALEMFMTARRIKADKALIFGLIDEIVEDALAAALAL